MEQKDLVEKTTVNEEVDANGLPQTLIEEVKNADGIIFFHVDGAGNIVMRGTVKSGKFDPDRNIAHAFVAAIYKEYQNIASSVSGVPTDADRYRALREFALLAAGNKERFEAINVMLQRFEEQGAIKPESERTEQIYQDKFADFLIHALIETEPMLAAPTVAPEHTEDPKLYTGQPLYVPPGKKI